MNELRGIIEQISYEGTLSRATIRLSSGRVLEATLMNIGARWKHELVVGDAVHVGLPPDEGVVLTE